METQVLNGDDIRFLAQQPEYEVDVIVGQMTTLMQNITDLQQDTDDKVAKLESQNWFKRMCNTVLGKNKATKQEIQKNGDKVVTYISQSVAQLYNMNLINEKVLCSLGNRMNEVYMQVTTMYQEQLEMKAQISQIMAVQQQTLEAMGAFVSKLNEKIESVDNFHMLISEIQNGMYNDSSKLYNICMILSQLDKRQMDDNRKMNLLQDTMNRAGIITDDEITVLQCLQDIVALPQEKIGLIYMELCNFRNSYPANLFADMIEEYHFLSKMEKMSKKKEVLIQRVMDKYDLDADAAFPVSSISESFFENKQSSLINLASIPQIASTPESVTISDVTSLTSQHTENITDEQIEREFDRLTTGDTPDYDAAYAYVKPLAEQGFPGAQVQLGLMYQLGWSVDINENEAFKWYLKAAEQGHTDGASSVASFYAEGKGKIQADKKAAEFWFKKACDTGSTQEYLEYADFLFDEERYNEAFVWVKKAAEGGDDTAQWRLGKLYENGTGTNEDTRKAFTWYKKSADNNNCIGKYLLATCYDNGTGCRQNEEEAFRWYSAADEDNLSTLFLKGDAKRKLGICYWMGKGIDADAEMACQLWTEAYDEEGDKASAFWLGLYYQNYVGDYRTAVQMFKSFLNFDDEESIAIVALGEMYREGGNGIKQNYQTAYQYFKKAADLNDADAQNYLGLMFANGEHVQQNSHKANEWYQKAIENGHSIAKFNLACNIMDGNGIKKDHNIGLELMREAADEGVEPAQEYMEAYNKAYNETKEQLERYSGFNGLINGIKDLLS